MERSFSYNKTLSPHTSYLIPNTKPFLFCCLFLISFGLSAQQARQYSFTRYNTVTGLASNFVNNLVQDHRGFIWLATVNGLQRYDGHKFLTFSSQPGNPSAISNNHVTHVFIDRENNLWVATADNRIGLFNTETFTYKEVPVRWKMISTLSVPKKIFQANDGSLILFTTSYGIYTLKRKTPEFVPWNNNIRIPEKWKLNDIFQEKNSNRYWMAADSGLAVFDPGTGHLNYKNSNVDNDPVIEKFGDVYSVLAISTDEHRFFFVTRPFNASAPLLHYYNRKTDSSVLFSLSQYINTEYHEILGNLRQRNGRLWLYGRPFIVEFTNENKPFRAITNEYKNEQSIKFDQVNSMYEDRERNIWICTDNGLFLFNPDAQVFSSYSLIRPGAKEAVEGPVQAVLQLKNHQVWAGCLNLGLFCYDEHFNAIQMPASLAAIKETRSVWCMWQHRSSDLVWIGLEGGVMLVYNPATGVTKKIKPAIFGGSTIRQVTEDRRGNLWFGTQGGHVIKWTPALAGGDIEKGYSLIKKRGLIHKLFTDTKGFIWVATLGTGLDKIDPVSYAAINFSTSSPGGSRLFADAPTDILQYNDSLLIIANGAVDVLNTNTRKVTTINTEDGLPSNNVLCVQKDENGLLWLGMINGLCRMNLDKKIFINYDRRDGISTDNFSVAGAFQLSDKKLVFTTEHDFLVFNPSEMMQKDPPPEAKVISFRMANRSLLVDSLNKLKKISLEYNKNSITIGFGSLSYLRANKKVFYYQLENIDDGWILADDRHEAIYNYLPPGTYRFKVKSVNGFGITSRNITTVTILVKSPFWKTWWFYGMLLLAGIAFLYWIDRERFRRMLTLQQLRTQIATNLHEEITTTLNNIHLLSEIAKIKVDKDIVKSKEYIDQINTKSRRMIDDMDDMLWSIDPLNDNMQKTIERMNEFTDGLQRTHGCSVQLVIDRKVQSLKLDMKTRHEIFFIFKEALNSIIQHSDCADSVINIDLVKSSLLLKIHDNGINMDVKSILNNNEIKEMQKRARLLNAVLDIQSDKRGTTMILKVPV